jgi:glycosyltransferase involved in cell wall biosynthesis
MLARKYEVWPVYIKDLKNLLRKAMICDIYYTWFCSANAFLLLILRHIFRKKLVVVTGGYDVIEIPEIGYGLGQESWTDYLFRRPLRNFSIPRIDMLLAFSKSSAEDARRRGAKKNLKVIYCSVDTDFFTPPSPNTCLREPLVLTVGTLAPVESKRKGHFTFLEASSLVTKKLPEARFCIAGRDFGFSKVLLEKAQELGVSVELVRNPRREELRALYRRAYVYVQASAHEGFGISLGEAMACGCLPIGTKRGAIPEVIGPCGTLVEYGDTVGLAEAIMQTLRSSGFESASEAARKRIVENFSEEKRLKMLSSTFEELMEEKVD